MHLNFDVKFLGLIHFCLLAFVAAEPQYMRGEKIFGFELVLDFAFTVYMWK